MPTDSYITVSDAMFRMEKGQFFFALHNAPVQTPARVRLVFPCQREPWNCTCSCRLHSLCAGSFSTPSRRGRSGTAEASLPEAVSVGRFFEALTGVLARRLDSCGGSGAWKSLGVYEDYRMMRDALSVFAPIRPIYFSICPFIGLSPAAFANYSLDYVFISNPAAPHAAEWTQWEEWANDLHAAWVGQGWGFDAEFLGQPLFFFMCLLMIPVATAELGTDQWIKNLMNPVLGDMGVNAAYAIVFSASIMLIFRVFAGGILQFFSPPTLLCISGVFSAAGLYWLSGATGAAIFVAFTLYALGQTYYWPCVLGFTSERYPQGGALTLNTVSAIGLLSVGIIGGQLLGVGFDKSIHTAVSESAPEMAAASSTANCVIEPDSFKTLAARGVAPPLGVVVGMDASP